MMNRRGKKLIKKRVEYEHLEQCALIERVKFELEPKFPECKWFYAIPNEGGKGIAGMIRSAMMKKEGMRKGVSDLCLPSPRWRPKTEYKQVRVSYMGLYIEMKPAPVISPVRKKVSIKPMKPEQQEFQDFALSQGYAAVCCNGQEEAMIFLKRYLNLDRIAPYILNVSSNDICELKNV